MSQPPNGEGSLAPKGPQPQPEHAEPVLPDPGLRDLTRRDWAAVVRRAGRRTLDDAIPDAAAAIAYYAFTALPSILLAAFGVFTLLAGPDAVGTVVDRLSSVLPEEALALVRRSLDRALSNQSGSVAMIAAGGALAVWTATGAMTALMRGLNRAYGRRETRGFLRQRATALAMLVFGILAFLLVFGLLILGPALSQWVGSAVGMEGAIAWIWWAAQWPVLLLGLALAFAGVLYLGPDVDHPRFRFISPGSLVAVVGWLAASGLFAVYVSKFGSYDKAWGSLAAVIITLVWFWLTALMLLFGAEINAEAERSRELRRGEPAERELVAPARCR